MGGDQGCGETMVISTMSKYDQQWANIDKQSESWLQETSTLLAEAIVSVGPDHYMSITPPAHLYGPQPPSLSPMKLESSNSSLSSSYRPSNTVNNPPFPVMTSSQPNPSQQQPNGHTKPSKKPPPSNLFIPRKPPRRPVSSNPASQPNTPKPAIVGLNGVNGPSQSNSSALNSHVNSPRPVRNNLPTGQSQPKGISQAPPPLDAPFVEFDLLTGDLNGPLAPSGFNPPIDWNIFKFHRIPGNKTINTAFEFPIKLNRKNYKYLETGMDIDDEEEMGDSSTPLAPGAVGASGVGGLLEGLDLQDLKNVIVPGSASQIGNPSVKLETPGVGPSLSGVAKPGNKNEKLVPLRGPDGQQVIGPDGQPVMVPATMAAQVKGGRLPFIPGMMPDYKGKKAGALKGGKGPGGTGGAGTGKPGDSKPGEGRKRGGKKTRQVYMIPEHARKLKKEERYPWLWEDAGGKEIWEGRRVERNRVKMQLLQVCKDGTFRWYPAKKHYMFTKLPTWRVPNAEEANERFEKDQRRRNPLYFAENTRHHAGFSRAFRQQADLAAMEDRKGGIGSFSGEAVISGANRLRLVDRGRPVSEFDRDDGEAAENDDIKKEILREKDERDQEFFGMEGDIDEMEYEDDVADDDEKVHADGMEEEEKEYEDRLKREWRQANKTEVEVVDRAFLGNKPRLGKEGRRIKKMLRGQDKTGELYETDDDGKDPYASEEESDSESDIEERERLEKEKSEKEKAEKARKEEEERVKELLEEKEREREAAEKEKKGKVPNKNDSPTSKNVAGVNGKASGGGKSSANASRGGSPKPRPGGKGGSRAGSPAIRSTTGVPAQSAHNGSSGGAVKGPSGLGSGNALTAMRATSPGSPKPRAPMGLNTGSTRMSSPTPSGVSTPVPGGSLKRKAENQTPNSGPHKKQKTASPTPSGSAQAATPSNNQPKPQVHPPSKKKKTELFPGCLTQDMVVNYLKEREAKGLKTQTKDAIERFKPMWVGAGTNGAKEGVDGRNKELLTHWIKKVANLGEGNWLTLR